MSKEQLDSIKSEFGDIDELWAKELIDWTEGKYIVGDECLTQ